MGGYFGAGIGILMLVVLGFLGLTDIHAMNGLKNFFGITINAVAAAWFIFNGAVLWPVALVMIAGATIGGYAGARFARRIGKEKARAAVFVPVGPGAFQRFDLRGGPPDPAVRLERDGETGRIALVAPGGRRVVFTKPSP